MNSSDSSLGDLSMLDLFLMEVETQTQTLNAGLLRLESTPTDPDTLEELMRAAHSLKGAARIVRLENAIELAHEMEDCFGAAQQNLLRLDAEALDLLFQAVDLFSRLRSVSAEQLPHWLNNNRDTYIQQTHHLRRLRSVALPSAEINDPTHITDIDSIVSGEVVENEKSAATSKPSHEANQATSSRRVVRVSSDSLNRIMSLTSESMVQTRWMRPFSQSLLRLRRRQWDLERGIEQLRNALVAEKRTNAYSDLLDALQRDATQCREMITQGYNDFEEYARRSSNLVNRLYREALASRMRPFSEGVSGFPRMIRDLARQLGKKVRIVIHGKNTEVDRDILDRLEAPLNHLLRNAISHGIEHPQERIAQGKPEEGRITLEAAHHSGMLSITVKDDGRGVDPENIRARVVERSLIATDAAERLSDKELLDFLFLPRFTTADQVTELSGRGFGLDIVQTMTQEVHGIARASSTPGQGFCVHLRLPLTLSVVRALLFEVAGELLSIPLSRISRILREPREKIRQLENKPYITIDDRNIGLALARQVLEFSTESDPKKDIHIIVLNDGEYEYGLVVDAFRGEQSLVVRPLDARLGKIPDVSAVGILRDGSAALILDADDLMRSIENILTKGRLSRISNETVTFTPPSHKRILVVDDSLTVREAQRRLLQHHGYEVDSAVDGVDGWNALQTHRYDLVITDVDMPRMNGIELVRRIKGDPAVRDVPAMIVSYKDREEDRMRGFGAGANYYLTKTSFHDESLVKAVIELIGEATA